MSSSPAFARSLLLSALAPLLLLACASAPAGPRCRADEQRAITDSLYFGTAMPGGQVSLEQWQGFLADVITPRFPEGLTSWAAAGQWQDAAGKLEKENSYVLHIVHPDTEPAAVAIREVISIYKTRFHQQAVLHVRTPACISF